MVSLLWVLYEVVAGVALVTAGPILLVRRGRHYLQSLGGRLGAGVGGRAAVGGRGALWLHAVSVGEVGVAATLARSLPPHLPLLVTTVTPTGQALARRLFAGRAAVAYLPFELGPAVARFWRRFAPAALVLVEGDYWPLLLREARRHGIPVAVVNGRVGDRSFRRMRRLRRLTGLLFDGIGRFGMQSAEDRDRLAALGVPAERLTVTGNLKFETAAPPENPALLAAVRRLAAGRPVLVAGSTMAGEEEQVAAAFRRLGGGAAALLAVAPRHPERWDEVERRLRREGLTVVRRSAILPAADSAAGPESEAGVAGAGDTDGAAGAGGTVAGGGAPGSSAGSGAAAAGGAAAVAGGEVAATPDVLLLDSLGELAGLYGAAAAAFVGGTLVPTGGHNPLEAARCGIPIAVGPSMHNFRDMAERFDRAGAWQRVEDAAGLGRAWQGWLADAGEARRQGALAAGLVEENRGALDQTLAMLAPILAPFLASPAAGREPAVGLAPAAGGAG